MRVLGFTIETSFNLKIRWAKPQEKIVYVVRAKKTMFTNSKKKQTPTRRSFRTPTNADQKLSIVNGKPIGTPIAIDKEIVSLYQAGKTQAQIVEQTKANQSTVSRRLKVYEQKPKK